MISWGGTSAHGFEFQEEEIIYYSCTWTTELCLFRIYLPFLTKFHWKTQKADLDHLSVSNAWHLTRVGEERFLDGSILRNGLD